MTLLSRAKAMPLPPADKFVPYKDGFRAAFFDETMQAYARAARELIAAEGDAVIAKLCEALEDLLDTGYTGGPQGKRARAALAEARKE